MGKRKFPFVAALLAAAYLPVLYGVWVIGHTPGLVTRKHVAPSRHVAWAEQCDVSLHESGHALAVAYLYDPRRLSSLKVWTKTDEEGLLGAVYWHQPDAQTLPEALKNAAVSIAGRAADACMNGSPNVGARRDLRNATDDLMRFRIAYGLGGALVVKPSASDEDYRAVEHLMQIANKCAVALMQANQGLLQELGDLAVSAKVEDGRRTLTKDDLLKFFREHEIAPPLAVPESGVATWPDDDPCEFPSEI